MPKGRRSRNWSGKSKKRGCVQQKCPKCSMTVIVKGKLKCPYCNGIKDFETGKFFKKMPRQEVEHLKDVPTEEKEEVKTV